MEKEHRWFTVFTILIIFILVGTLIWVNLRARNIQPSHSSLTPSEEGRLAKNLEEVPVLTDTKEQSTDTEKHYTIEAHYPLVSLAAHPELAKDTNTVIAAFVHDAIESFKSDVTEMYSPNVPKDFSSDLSIRWTALLVSPTVLSIRFDESAYIAGSAHPNSQSRVLNYDLEKHLLLQSADLFASTTEAVPFLSRYSRNALTQILADEPKDIFDTQALPGTEPTTENFTVVGVNKGGLLVIFNPYQVAPYARGTIQIPIPISDLNGQLSPRILDAIKMAGENIVEAVPEEASTTP